MATKLSYEVFKKIIDNFIEATSDDEMISSALELETTPEKIPSEFISRYFSEAMDEEKKEKLKNFVFERIKRLIETHNDFIKDGLYVSSYNFPDTKPNTKINTNSVLSSISSNKTLINNYINNHINNSHDIYFFVDFETTGVDPIADYPIEVGGVFVAANTFMPLHAYSSLIKLPKEVEHEFINEHGEWKDNAVKAFELHKITPEEIHNRGKSIEEVVDDLLNIIGKIKKMYIDLESELKLESLSELPYRIIMISDNAQFVHTLMYRLFKMAGKEFPFHQYTMDTNILFHLGISSITEEDKREFSKILTNHVALPDALQNYYWMLFIWQKYKQILP